MTQRLSIDDAARAMGISRPTVKRRLKRGELRAVQEPTPSGFKWLVLVEAPESPDSPGDSPESPAEPAHDSPAEPPLNGRVSPQSPQEGLGELVRLVQRLQEENRQIAGQAGYYRAKWEDAEAQLKLLQAPPVDLVSDGNEVQPARPWWRFW